MSSTDTDTNKKVFKHPLGTIAFLNDMNYASWKADCEQVLHGIKGWRIVMGDEVEPENPKGMTKAAIHGRRAYEDFTTRKAQVGAIIYGSCSPEVKTHLNQVSVGIASRRSPLRCGAPVEASPQQRRRQQRCGEQWHSNGSGKGIPATTAWHSLIAASSAFFLLSFYILLYRKRNRRSSHVNDTIISSNLFLSLSLCSCEDFKRNGDRANFYRL